MASGPPFVGRRRDVLIGGLTAYLAVVAAAPVATTPYRSDDIVNRQVPELFSASGQSFVEYFAHWVGPWITHEGRFFPGSSLWTFVVFTTFESRLTYKLFLGGLVLLMVALIGATVATLTMPPLVPVAVAALTATLHLRDYFDGLDTFSGVLPFTICATLVCLLLLLRRRSHFSAVVVTLLWTYVLLTYEVAIVLTPTLVILVWWCTRRPARTVPVALPAAVVTVVVLVLRSRVTTYKGDAYRINLEPERVAATYVKQVAGALPWSTQWYPGTTASMSLDTLLLFLVLLLVGVPTALLLTLVARRPVTVPRQATWTLAFLGSSMWFLPPLLVAISLGWQNELPRGQAYVSVVWGYVGVALLATSGWLALASSRRPRRRIALHMATVVIALAATASVAQSVAVAMLLAPTT